ncbi:Siderophore biosynthesis non-ribosomal peptide synthetase [Minicystis rosea]|nr:Siderophore biosynthesis non-ribosomal peptide synthetase [Minicystis rosea]
MTDLDLIRQLSALGVRLWAEGESLKWSAPKGALTEEMKERLRARKEAIVTFLQRTARRDSSAMTIPRAARDGALPASFGQERLWFLEQLEPGGIAYVLPSALRIEGPLEEDALRRALGEIARRHEVLRTTLALADGVPVQVIHAPAPVDLPVEDLTALPAEDRDRVLRDRLATEARRPFSLEVGPLLRARLFRMAAEDHVFCATVHHAVFDGWSQAIFARELGGLYDAFIKGQPSTLDEPVIQYADFAAWQRRALSGEALADQLAWWTGQLDGAPASIDLPIDRPRPATQSYRGAQRAFAIAPAVSEGLRAVAQREGVTLFMLLLAAFQTLLHRLTGQNDVVVGSPSAGRSRPETEELIGFFVNTLVLRARIDPAAPFRALLAQVKETCLGAYAHQDLPFERLVQEIAPHRDPSRHPLFQVLFALQNAPRQATQMTGTRRRAIAVGTGTAKVDLNLALVEGNEGIHGTFEYATDLFDGATIEWMIGCFTTLLEGVAADPGRSVDTLPILTTEEEARLIAAAGGTESFATHASLHGWFASVAARSPEAVAVTCEGQSLTYRALDEQSNQVARALRRRGVGREVLVGLCMDRTLAMVVGMLGILKAGGAYLPLDPEVPRERLAFMLEDAEVALVVTEARHASLITTAVLCLDVDAEEIGRESVDALAVASSPEDLAYVIYTSGSTGKPKGALVTHGNVVRLFAATEGWYGFGASDVWTMFHSYAFDFSVWEIWGALFYGGRLVIVPYWVSRFAESFHALLVSERVTVLNQTPSAFRQLMHADANAGDAARDSLALRYVIFGGEALDIGALRPWWELHGDVSPQLVNMYGITETTVHVTYRPLCRADLERSWSSVIGVPIPDLSVHVLDERGRPVPVGVVGELHVGGAGVARGYLRRPELTAARFLEDPYRGEGRLYKTGDLGRRLGNGDIEYLGRIDHQVKIRGFRIELGEIESALSEHESVREAVVLSLDDGAGDKRLCAYVVFSGAPVPAVDLRAFLKERLPEYMVPSAYVALPSLPLTSNGKIDRRALPAPESLGLEERAYVAARGPVEEAIARVFAEVLRVPRVGAHDGFFELGGHSLSATRVVARLRAVLGVELPLRALFEAPTVAGLAGRLGDVAGAEALAITVEPPGVPRVLSFVQERLWFIDQLAPGDPSYVVPVAIRLSGALDAGALERALREIVRRHEVLRTTYDVACGKPVAVVHDVSEVTLALSSLADLPESEREGAARREIEAEALRPFDLARGPVMRARLIGLSEHDHVLVVALHHIVSDAWSIGVLTREMGALYDAFVAGRPSPLADLSIQYADYAAWQRRTLSGEREARQLAYWKDRLAGAPRTIELFTDKPRPPVSSHRGARVPIAVPEAVTEGLRRIARDRGATLFMTLLAGFEVLLHRYTEQTDLVVGTPIAGRTRSEVEGLIGCFVNTLALRVELSAELPFADLIARAREACLGAYAHQDLPFERLVQALEPERDPSRSPIFQIVFVLQNAPVAGAKPSEIGRRGFAAESGTAKFDLTFTLVETASGLAGGIEFATDLFEAPTIARMARHFEVLLAAAVAEPTRPIGELTILPEEELRRVVTTWNATRSEYPREATIHALFQAQAARTPDATALVRGDESISYGELLVRAHRLAHRLREMGVGAETAVGVYARRSIDLVVALVAVLEAGGFYVPLDPEMPDARLAWIVEDAAIGIVVAAGASLDGRAIGEVRVLDLAAASAWIAAASESPPEPSGHAEGLAYVMYTSGSTGTPKGVAVVHRGVVRLVKAQSYLPFDASEVFLQLAPIAFDASTLEIWGPLLSGGRLVMAPPEVPSLAQIGELIRTGGVTTSWLTAGLFNAMIDAHPEALRPLRRVLAGGEALSVPHVRRAMAALPGVQIINGYGPTENTTFTTCHVVTEGDLEGSIPIGRPIANTTVYILDPRGRPVPIGVPGELHAGGDGVARGYVRAHEGTSDRFVPDPFDGRPGARLYRTGDRARWLPDGTIAFSGRRDFQVKLRGFRIELGEIEAQLAHHSDVAEAVVMLREDVPGEPRLVGYVAAGERRPAPAELRAFLEARLPGYMVPPAFVIVDALPLTPNGKVDRRALGALGAGEIVGAQTIAPRGPIEETLAGLFAEVLRVAPERVGAQDGFFALGGHSLLATQLVARVRAVLGVDLPIRAVFEASTVAALAERTRHALAAGRGLDAPPLVAVTREPAMPVSFAEERLWFLHQLDPAAPSYAVPFPMRFSGGSMQRRSGGHCVRSCGVTRSCAPRSGKRMEGRWP